MTDLIYLETINEEFDNEKHEQYILHVKGVVFAPESSDAISKYDVETEKYAKTTLTFGSCNGDFSILREYDTLTFSMEYYGSGEGGKLEVATNLSCDERKRYFEVLREWKQKLQARN
jgi:hypothetical protein